jgi:hypothetical protein
MRRRDLIKNSCGPTVARTAGRGCDVRFRGWTRLGVGQGSISRSAAGGIRRSRSTAASY